MAGRTVSNVGIREVGGMNDRRARPCVAAAAYARALHCLSPRGGSMHRRLVFGLALLAMLARAEDPPEVTEDGLVRVPSNRKVGVYRAPDVPFARYRRISIGSIPVVFRKNWEKDNPRLKEADLERLRGQLVRIFREELIAELVKRGGYVLTDAADADVLRLDPSIIDLDITAPDAGNVPGVRTLVRTTGSMKLNLEVRDAASSVTVARIIDYE